MLTTKCSVILGKGPPAKLLFSRARHAIAGGLLPAGLRILVELVGHDLRFRKLCGVEMRGSVCALGSHNLAKLGKACPYKSFGKPQRKQQKSEGADALRVRTGIHVSQTPTSGGES
jgi:hypothetical protein